MAFISHSTTLKLHFNKTKHVLRDTSSAQTSGVPILRVEANQSRPVQNTSRNFPLPWQRKFEAAVLNQTPTQPPHPVLTDAPASPPGLTAARIRRLLLLIWGLAAPFWLIDNTAIWHALACATLLILDTIFGAIFTELNGGLFTALNERNVSAFASGTFNAFVLLMIAVPTSALSSFIRSTLVLRWQQFLTKRGLKLYFENSNFYQLSNIRAARQKNGDGDAEQLDNPDEVIQTQFADFADNMVDIAMSNLSKIVEIVLYSLMLLRIFPPLYLCILAIVGAGMFLINQIGKRLVDLQAILLRRTADFRFALARIRIHAESIAFYNGANFERDNAENKLDSQASTILALLKTRFPVNMFINSFFYLPSIIPLLLLGPLYFSQRIQLGQLTKAVTAFNVLFQNLSLFVDEYNRYASLGASVERLSNFVSALEQEKNPNSREFTLPPRHVYNRDDFRPTDDELLLNNGTISFQQLGDFSGLELHDVWVNAPGGSQSMLRDISFSLPTGSRLLIVGRSGRGKTSLLRAIAGLWTTGRGSISSPSRAEMFFMPQRPYCVQGTLREQLLYPNKFNIHDDELEQALCQVGLNDLLERAGGFDSICDWAEYLSVGENQRLAFARLLVSKPTLVLVDEGTSALDLPTEDMLMRQVSKLGCTLVSVGHRPSLVKYHDQVLHLKGESNTAGYELVRSQDFRYPGVADS